MPLDFFANKPSNKTPESIAKQAEILFDLYSSKSSLASIESKFESEGKSVSRYISQHTVFYLTWIYIFPGLLSLLLPLETSITIYIFFIFLTIPAWWFLPSLIAPSLDDSNFTNWIKENLAKEKRTKRFKIWKYCVTVSPFSIRTIWMWVIIFGVYAAYREAGFYIIFQDANGKLPNVDTTRINTFALSFLRTMIVAIVSYIATNIISDLIDLKEEYIKGKKKINELTTEISASANNLKQDISSSNDLIKEVTSELKNQKFFAPLQTEYDNFQQVKASKYNSPSDRLNKSFEQYSELLSKQIGILGSRLTGNPVIDLWILTGLKSAAELRVTQIEEQNSITTLFEVFGNIIAACLENFDDSDDKNLTEIYTVFALPPNRYLNYNGSEPLSKNWKHYLEKNIEAASKGVQIHRHFLSFTNARNEIIGLAGEEGADLGDLEAQQKWKEKYWTKSDGYPYFNESLQRFQKADESVDDKTLIAKPLHEILAATYHCESCCKLIKVDLTKNWKDILYSEKYTKPIDYFALKSTSTNDWIFCFKTYYDKGFNAAIVEFWHDLHPQHDDWLNIKTELNRLFTNDKAKGIEIKNITSIN